MGSGNCRCQDASFYANLGQALRRQLWKRNIETREEQENLNTIGYRNRFYEPRQTWPQLDPPKAYPPPQAARNEQRTDESNEQSPPPVTPETPDSANSLNPSAGVEQFEPYMRLLRLIDSELWRNGQPTWEGGAEELQRELTKEGSPCARKARQLLKWNGACARLLGRLHHAHPERIARIHHNHARAWLIYCSQASTVTPVTPKPQGA